MATERAPAPILLQQQRPYGEAAAPERSRWLDLVIAWVVFLGLAYLPNYAPERSITLTSLTLFWAFFAMTFMILCDQVIVRLEGRSLLQETTQNGAAWLRLLATGALSGLLLDGVAQWLGKLWIYPYWDTALYGGTFVVGFCAYWLATAESYLTARAILRRWRPERRPAQARKRYERWLFPALGVAGALLMAAGIWLLLSDYRQVGGYVFEIEKPLPVKPHFRYFLMTFAGVWLVLEWVQFALGRQSLLGTVLQGRWIPVMAMLAASAVSSLLWETVNAAHHFWIYTNWPWPNWALMTIPGTVLLSWPLQYVVFLSIGFFYPRDLWE